MKKKLLCLAIAVCMAVGAPITASAKDYPGKDGWSVEFDGSKMNSSFTSDDITETTTDIQPGDSITMNIAVKNSGTTDTDWYMSNEVIRTLEDATKVATGGTYEYRLTYTDPKNAENVLYDSNTVGGEGQSGQGTGLHQATDSLEKYFYLGRLTRGQGGSVHLRVAVDGETQGNNYQKTLAKLQMKFAVEKVKAGETITRTKTVTRQAATTNIRKTVKTGDTNRLILLSAIALLSGIVLLIIGVLIVKRRKDNSGEGEQN
ncbi:MAG: hypothetical protein PHG16_04840 [Lachnospiraceae bacterium]|nr:hypothetical protein [Lachnospiraceae bacterium]